MMLAKNKNKKIIYYYGKGVRKSSRAFSMLYPNLKSAKFEEVKSNFIYKRNYILFTNKLESNGEMNFISCYGNENNKLVSLYNNIYASEILINRIEKLFNTLGFKLTDFVFQIRLYGGGFSSRIDAIMYSIVNSFKNFLQKNLDENEFKEKKRIMRNYGFISIDSRKAEKTKYGHKGPRASLPYVKR